MKNVLIINEGHTSNLGDKLIQMVMCKLFEKNNVMTKRYVPIETYESMEENILVGKTPKYVNFINKVIGKLGLTLFFNDIRFKSLIKRELRNQEIDLAIIGGGELISDNLIFNSALYCWVNELYKKNIPIVITGVSGNETKGKAARRYKEIIKKAQMISVRDKKTKEILKRLYNVVADYVPDFAFLYDDYFEHYDKSKKGNIITAQIYCKHYLPLDMLDDSIEEYFGKWINLIKTKTDDETKIVLSYTNKEDRDYTNEFYHYCMRHNIFNNIELRETDSIEKYVELLNETNLIISGRMHAMILAMLYKNEILPFAFKEKIIVFNEEWIGKEDKINAAKTEILNYISLLKNKYGLE